MERPNSVNEAIKSVTLIMTNSGTVVERYINELEKRIELIQDLAIGYDGFNTVEGLKSLIGDIVKTSKGELEIEK